MVRNSVVIGKPIRTEIGSGIFSSGSVQTVLSHFHQKSLKNRKKTSKSVRRHPNDYFKGWNRFRAEPNWTDSEPKFQFGSSLTENRLQPYTPFAFYLGTDCVSIYQFIRYVRWCSMITYIEVFFNHHTYRWCNPAVVRGTDVDASHNVVRLRCRWVKYDMRSSISETNISCELSHTR